jgi:hAT family C-terminal dimerisation region
MFMPCSIFFSEDVFGEVSKLLRLFLVIPATSATAERSFSAMRRLKTYLRSTMTAERLNSIMLLHVHKDKLEDIDDYETISSFVSCSDKRRDLFGT